MSAYQLNLHRHVRIWFNENPDEFMPLTNQLRLVKFRATNPEDTMTLIYAENLLSPKAKDELTKFAAKQQITLLSLEELGKKIQANENKDEYALYELAVKEITSVKNKTGSFAAAKDILQWISKVYVLGIYSDFDTTINTQGLPESMPVDAPIVTQVGSVPHSEITSAGVQSYEIMMGNTDIFAVSDIIDSSSTEARKSQLAMIKRAHSYMLRCYKDSKQCMILTKKIYDARIRQLNDRDQEFNKNAWQVHAKRINELTVFGDNPFTIRQNINRKYASVETFLQHSKLLSDEKVDVKSKVLERHRRAYAEKKDYPWMKGVFDADENKALEILRDLLLQEFLKNTNIRFTGGFLLCYALGCMVSLKANVMEATYKKYSLSCYGLTNAFSSGFNLVFHDHDSEKRAATIVYGSAQDVSWLEPGKKAMQEKEFGMRFNARRIQFWYHEQKSKRLVENGQSTKPEQPTGSEGLSMSPRKMS